MGPPRPLGPLGRAQCARPNGPGPLGPAPGPAWARPGPGPWPGPWRGPGPHGVSYKTCEIWTRKCRGRFATLCNSICRCRFAICHTGAELEQKGILGPPLSVCLPYGAPMAWEPRCPPPLTTGGSTCGVAATLPRVAPTAQWAGPIRRGLLTGPIRLAPLGGHRQWASVKSLNVFSVIGHCRIGSLSCH